MTYSCTLFFFLCSEVISRSRGCGRSKVLFLCKPHCNNNMRNPMKVELTTVPRPPASSGWGPESCRRIEADEVALCIWENDGKTVCGEENKEMKCIQWRDRGKIEREAWTRGMELSGVCLIRGRVHLVVSRGGDGTNNWLGTAHLTHQANAVNTHIALK